MALYQIIYNDIIDNSGDNNNNDNDNANKTIRHFYYTVSSAQIRPLRMHRPVPESKPWEAA